MSNTTPKQQINIKLDLQKGWLNPKTIQLKQSDHNARIFMIRLVNTLPINLTGCQPTLFVKRAEKGWLNPKTIQLKQSDHNARIFMIRLVNTLPINLTGCQPTLFVKRADGSVVSGLGQMTRAEQGEFLVPLNSTVLGVVGQAIVEVVIVKDGEEILSVVSGLGQMTRAEQGEFLVPLNSTVLGVVGQAIVEVVIVKDGEEILSFPHFNFEILESFHNSDEVAEDEEVGILWELIGETRTALDEMDGRFVDFVNTKDQEFQRAESVRNQNETIRQQGYIEMQNKVRTALDEMDGRFVDFVNTKDQEFQRAESVRNQNETIRQQGYIEMQNKVNQVYSTTLKYRIVE